MSTLKLEEWAAAHPRGLLAGVWRTTEIYERSYDAGEASDVMYFLFDGVIYRAQENPDDGYRSSLGPFEERNRLMPANVWEPAEPVHVTFADSYEEYGSKHSCDSLLFVSERTGLLVMEIGTRNTDDYYPTCTLYFDPLGLSHNQQEIDLLGRERG